MSKKRSDALQALVAEVVDLDAEILVARDGEDEARRESVAARQALDLKAQKRQELEERRSATQKALDIIKARDLISDETIVALAERAAGRNGR